MSARALLVLDSLFDDLDAEAAVAASRGWSIGRWDGSDAALAKAKAVLHVRTRIDGAFMARMPECRVVGRFGTGLDSVDLAAAAERGIRVVGVGAYCVPELASHTLGLAFALDRHVDGVRSHVLDPDDSWQDVATRIQLDGRITATVVGMGSVGTAVARALGAIGITVSVVTRHGAEAARAMGARPVTLEEGLADAGFIFLHTALTAETEGMIDARALALMSPRTILVNTARIGLMDEAAVASALEAGRLAGLGLDARLGPGSPLRHLLGSPSLMVTPHIGWYSTRSARELRERTVTAAIDAFLHSEGESE